MDCTAIRPLISYYYDGETTPEEREQVDLHLAGCLDCRRVMSQYRTIGSEIRDMAVPIPPAGLHRDVWRAIEAQEAGTPRWKQAATAGPRGKVVDISAARAQKRGSLADAVTKAAGGWTRAVPAALVVAALGIMVAVFIFIQGRTPGQVASLIQAGPYTNYNMGVQVLISKEISLPEQVENNTEVSKVSGASLVDVPVRNKFEKQTLTISPVKAWEAGATYRITIRAPRIQQAGSGAPLDNEDIVLNFSMAAHTPTPTPTLTPVPPSATAVPTDTQEPTQIVAVPTATVEVVATATQESTPEPTQEPSAEPTDTPQPSPTDTIAAEPAPTDTPAPLPTDTPTEEPTATPEPPSVTPTATETATAAPTKTQTPVVATPTSTPVLPSPTSTPSQPCSIMPVNGFGKIWNEDSSVQSRLGCPQEAEYAILAAADERFEGGYMFWREDTKRIYVFIGDPNNDLTGTWLEYSDTWVEGTPLPTPQGTPGVRGSNIPPIGKYAPVRGFGMIWRADPVLRERLGWALEPEQAVTAAFQTFEGGYGLWTSDKVIRIMYRQPGARENIWMRFTDTFVSPTATVAP